MLTPHWVPAHVALLVAWVFVLFGLMGMYARQAQRAGILGLIGFLLTMVGGMGNLYFYFFHAFVAPVLAKDEGCVATREKGDEQMQAYYWKVYRQLLSTTILTGFGSLN